MLTPEEESLFVLAVDMPPGERAVFLDRHCGENKVLRQRLESLLAAHEHPDTRLAAAAEPARPTIKLDLAEVPGEAVGQVIGRYKLLEKVGEGGCGVVYVAEQTEPVRRRVALKVIKLGMNTRAVVARFEAERQALAIMDHPNIAKVLDAGTTEQGRPYFVMELVRSIRITDYCDQNHLSTRERLDLFIKVCHAIQHAHQKGIIHRDIKPSNILVTLHDGVPVPKVIDFGIAKATEGRLTDATVYTQLHQFIGTPAYMSPEQAEMSGLDIDTRSDIYSLGVLLYEMLTGKTPFDAKELMAQGIDAMRKTIREKEPARPSTKLATLQGEELTTTAKRRSSDSARLLHQLRGDLDWIAMKCLEKDRTRRYETASGLAADIQRHLSNEPVTARPPSAAYQFQKLVRRNMAASVAIAAVTFGLVFGVGFASYAFVRERQAFRAMLAAERQAAIERARFALASGDERRVDEAVRDAQRVGVQPELTRVFRASFLVGAGRNREAIELVKPMVDVVPPSVAALSLYAMAHMHELGWMEFERLLPRLRSAEPVTHEDHLFLGQALVLNDTRMGLAHLEKARRLQDSPMARTALAEARLNLALIHRDAAEVEQALQEMSAAEAWSRGGLLVLQAASLCYSQAALFYQRLGDTERAEANIRSAQRAGRHLEALHPHTQALSARLLQLLLCGFETEALGRAREWARQIPGMRYHSVILSWETGDSRSALDQYRMWQDSITPSREVWELLQMNLLMTLDLPEEQAEHRRLLNELLSQPVEDSTGLYVTYIVFAARGELEKAQEIARAFRARHPEHMASLGPHFSRVLHYKCGELGEDRFLADSRDSAFNLMEAHYFVGLSHLARKNRDQAIEHFAAGLELGGNPGLRGIFRRLRDNPNWPGAIPD